MRISNSAQRQNEKNWYETKRGEKTFKVTSFFSPTAAKHFSVQGCSTFMAQTNFTRGINMAEILGFYELLHSAGGRVSGVMCSARLDLNSLDIEKGWNKLTRKEQRGAQRLWLLHSYYIILSNYCYYYCYYWFLHQYNPGAHVHSIQWWQIIHWVKNC